MSYIFIDVDEARRCAALIKAQADELRELTGGQTDKRGKQLEEFCRKLYTLSEDLLAETEAYASEDEKMKALHLMTNDKGSGNHGSK